jgi:molecular chaperone DnaK (HSP70)
LIKSKFGEEKIHQGQTSPDLAVAEGAALEALRLSSQNGFQVVSKSLKAIPTPMLKRTEAMPHSLGVKVLDTVTLACNCSVILERDTAIPASEVKSYCSISEVQDSFLIQVLQGEDGQAFDDCLIVGEQLLNFPPRDPSSASIDVEMSYNQDGMVRVLVTDKVSSEIKDITVDYYAKLA